MKCTAVNGRDFYNFKYFLHFKYNFVLTESFERVPKIEKRGLQCDTTDNEIITLNDGDVLFIDNCRLFFASLCCVQYLTAGDKIGFNIQCSKKSEPFWLSSVFDHRFIS